MLPDVLLVLFTVFGSAAVAFAAARYAVKSQRRNGAVRLLEIVRRYFLNIHDAFEGSPTGRRMKQDLTSKSAYEEELLAVLTDLTSLMTNPFFEELVEKTWSITKLIVYCRRELVTSRARRELQMEPNTILEFGLVHDVLRRRYPRFEQTDIDIFGSRLYDHFKALKEKTSDQQARRGDDG